MSSCSSLKNQEQSNKTMDLGATQYQVFKPEDFVSQADYTIVSDNYVLDDKAGNNIKIVYPKIIGFVDGNRQDEINNLLKNAAFIATKQVDQNLTLDLDYTISLTTNRLISVQYDGFYYVTTAAHPINYFHTVNIDLETGKMLLLQDMVGVDDQLADKIINQGNGVSEYLTSLEIEDIKNNYLLDSRREDWNTTIYECNSFYLTPDHLGISFPTIHAMGDHIEYEIPYEKVGILN